MVIDPSLPLGRRLKVLRVARGLRQRDLATSALLSPSVISMIETGDRPPRDSELRAILRALGVRREDVAPPRESHLNLFREGHIPMEQESKQTGES